MKLLFVIHAVRNQKTAVYRGYLNKKAIFEKHGVVVDILSPQDFPFSARAGRFMPLFYPFQVAKWLFETGIPFDGVIFHSYCGWVFLLFKPFFSKPSKNFKTAISFHGVEELYFDKMEEEGKVSGRPMSFRFWLFYKFFLVRLIRMSCRKVNRIFCLNNQEKKFLEVKKYQISQNIVVIPNDVPSDFFINRNFKEKATTLLFVGQWLPMKGNRYLVDAFPVLAARHPHLKFILAGTMKSREEVLKEFPTEMHSRLEIIAEMPHEQMIQYYQKADLFLMPSLFEAFNRALVEAMASALPTISTEIGILEDRFQDQVHYLKIPFRDPKAIIQTVESLLENPKRREALGLAAQQAARYFEQNYALELCFQRYDEFMKEVSA